MGCCDPKAPRLISIRVGDGQVGLRGLDIIVEAVRGLDLQKEEEIKQELLSRVKLFNYIPDSVNGKYAEALWEYYNGQG
ncbi:hypothetical protein [Desulforamulus reducens]|uniref:hypothetical protein n=1 Tax=Desulforamulus reducens TaxID=59610 RepID=UPI00059CC9B5|nr:hypothetical protein [Desulforamulus reducens]